MVAPLDPGGLRVGNGRVLGWLVAGAISLGVLGVGGAVGTYAQVGRQDQRQDDHEKIRMHPGAEPVVESLRKEVLAVDRVARKNAAVLESIRKTVGAPKPLEVK